MVTVPVVVVVVYHKQKIQQHKQQQKQKKNIKKKHISAGAILPGNLQGDQIKIKLKLMMY